MAEERREKHVQVLTVKAVWAGTSFLEATTRIWRE